MAQENVPENPNVPSPPFSLDDPRQRLIHERLTRLVGQSAAEFYKDACRFMSGSIQPPFSTTTNLISHALREVESSLRDVLVPLANQSSPVTTVEQTDETKAALAALGISEEELLALRNKKASHADEIRAILVMLGISEDEELAKAWIALPSDSKGLQRYAHRRGLRPIRPIDNDFRELWVKMETILHGVLDRFEARYLIIFESLDKLAQKPEPTRDDVSYFASSVPNNFISHSKFFEKLTNPKWLPLLRTKGVFKDPPLTEYGYENGGRTIRYPLWPAATYLQKMAIVEPVAVRDILLEVSDTDNANVKSALLEITTVLPKSERLSLVERVKNWVQIEHSMFAATKANELIKKLLSDGEVTVATDVSKVLLELHANPRLPITLTEGHTYTPSPDVRGRLDEWQYGQFMKDEFQRISEANRQAAFDLGVNLLNNFVTLSYPDHISGEEAYRDYTYISRPAIENHSQNHIHDDLEDYLIEAVRDVATDIVKSDPSKLGKVVEQLKQERWSVFIRLAMHVVAETPAPDPVIVKDLLLKQESFTMSELKHEYARLLGAHFGVLDHESKKTIYDWIDAAEEIKKRLAEKNEALAGVDPEKFVEHWQLEKLTLIGEHLESPWKERREELVAKYNEPEHPDFAAYSYESNGPESIKASQELLKMTPAEVIGLLKTWEPSESRRFFEPTREGLARELAAVIRAKPEFFDGTEKLFEGLDPTYIRTYIQTFHELSQNGRDLNWGPILNLCKWIVEQPRAIAGRTGEVMDQDPDWGWARGSINSLLTGGLSRNRIPYEFRELVWQIIAILAEDPNPTPEEDLRKEESYDDAYSRAINTVRGYAIQAAIEYGLWVKRRLEKTEDGKEDVKASLEDMPELKEVLEKHLDDPSNAIRAVYGRFLPWLLLIDKEWLEAQKEKIFPAGKFTNPLYKSGWSAYVLYSPAYSNVFPFLREQYQAAVADLRISPPGVKEERDPQRKLTEHLVATYWRGEITLDDPLLVSFWENASDELRGHVMDFIGRNLKSLEEPLAPDAEERLRALWTARYEVASAAADKDLFREEISGFGWWFASEQFDEEWISQQYLLALEFGSKTRTHHFVADRLVHLVNHHPSEALQILSKIIDLDQPSWIVMGSRDDIFSILRTALQADEQSQKTAREIINRLVARGNAEYAGLLTEFPDSPATA